MQKMEIIFDESLIKELLMIFKQSGVPHYTFYENIKGSGSSGKKEGTAAAPGRNAMLMTVIPPETTAILLRSIKRLKELTPNLGVKVLVSDLKEFV